MTVSYTGDICSTNSWSFLRMIFRWRGSIWKSVLIELSIWLALYYSVMFVFKKVLSDDGKRTFLFFVQYTGGTADYIPLTFLLGFFVKIVVDRWKEMFANIGFIDGVAQSVTAVVRGNDPETAVARRNIMRYLCLVQVLVLCDISIRVRKQFADMQSLIEAVYDGDQREQQHKLCQQFNKHWVPFNWLCQLCYHLRERGKIASDPLLGHLLREVNAFRERLQNLSNFDLVPIPLVYPQVVFISVRTYFLLCLFSRQNILSAETLTIKENEKHSTNFVELFFPVMTILQFIFYMGWTKVAEALLNPLGEDDDDFETLYVIERNITISMLLADQCHGQVPEQMDGSPVFSDRIRAETVINALIGSAVRTMPTKAKDGQQKSGDAVPKRRSKWTNKNLVERVRKSKGDEKTSDMKLPLNLVGI